MQDLRNIGTALVSVYHKDEELAHILRTLASHGVKLLSTGGTQSYIANTLGLPCQAVEDLTGYPSILGGRVKTLHPQVMGGILQRRDVDSDRQQAQQYGIPEIDLVIVDLYPFEETVASHAPEADIIEKIDIGGISLIRAAAKNFNDVAIVASRQIYGDLARMLDENQAAATTLEQRRWLARAAFGVSSAYDSAIFNYFDQPSPMALRMAIDGVKHLRYGENPHQEGVFFGRFDQLFDQLHGKEISYNNLVDIDAACQLMAEFGAEQPAFAILKHNNACGCAVRPTVKGAWEAALAGDPVSAFGGVLISNSAIDADAAAEIGKIFFEVIIAPAYSDDAMAILTQKKNRIILRQKQALPQQARVRTILNGALMQQPDWRTEGADDLRCVTRRQLTADQTADLIFANKLVKHSKSNAIVLAKGGQLVGSGVGQTSRVDALKQAIDKARAFGFDLTGAVMASDAFFPFGDCVEIAHQAGIDAVVQPGGSVRDNESLEYCDAHDMAMAMTGTRHFRH